MKTKICKNCSIEFNITKNNRTNIFCSHKCSAEFNNRNRPPMSEEQRAKISESLKKQWLTNPNRFSSGTVHSKRVGSFTKNKYKGNITSILDVSSRTTAKVIKRMNIGCCICGWNEAACDVHHINGRNIPNANSHSNLTYLCPNHHRLAHDGKIDKSILISLETVLPNNWKDYYYG